MNIPWKKSSTAEAINRVGKATLVENLGIHFLEPEDDCLKAVMPVDRRTHQPAGLLHGGASVALAETLGSTASYLIIDTQRQFCVGLEINANHLRPVSEGTVLGTAKPIHLGKTTHVWEIKITNELGKLVSIARLTMAVREKPQQP